MKGAHAAIKTGMLVAEAAFDALAADRRHDELTACQATLRPIQETEQLLAVPESGAGGKISGPAMQAVEIGAFGPCAAGKAPGSTSHRQHPVNSIGELLDWNTGVPARAPGGGGHGALRVRHAIGGVAQGRVRLVPTPTPAPASDSEVRGAFSSIRRCLCRATAPTRSSAFSPQARCEDRAAANGPLKPRSLGRARSTLLVEHRWTTAR